MRLIVIVAALLAAVLLLSAPGAALFADQAGLNDWTKQHIGEATAVAAAQDRLFVTTKQNVVAALTVDTGSIIWRRVLPAAEPPIKGLLVEKSAVVTWSEQRVYVWTTDGQLSWDVAAKDIRDVKLADANTVLVLTAEKLAAFSIASGQAVSKLSNDGLKPSSKSALLVAGGLPRIVSIESNGSGSVLSIVDTAGSANQYMIKQPTFGVLANGVLIYRGPKDVNTVIAKDFVSGSNQTIEIGHDGDIIADGQGASVVIKSENAATLLYVGEKGEVMKTAADPFKIVGVDGSLWTLNPENVPMLRNEHVEVSSGWARAKDSILVSLSDGRLVYFKTNAKGSALVQIWEREEALAEITSIVSTSVPHKFDTDSQNGGILSAVIKSIHVTTNATVAMIQSVKEAALQAMRGGQFDLKSVMEASEEERARFGFNRVLIVLTSKKRLFGIHSETSAILWTRNVQNLGKPVIVVLHEHDSDPRFLVLDSVTGKGEVISSASGRTSKTSGKSITSGKKILQILALESTETDKSKTALILTEGGDLFEWPYPARVTDAVFLHLMDKSSNVLAGYRVEPGAKTASLVWSMNFPVEMKLVGYASPSHSHDPLSSSVRSLGDGSLLVKYANANLVSLALQDDMGLKVFLVDTASGRVIHRNSHKEGTGPVHMVRFENWLVYSYWNTRAKRHDLVSVTLYEKAPIAKRQLNPWSTIPNVLEANVSGFTPVDLNVMQRTFYLPGADISALGVTTTLRGIAAKNLIVSIGGTGQVVMLDQRLIDPRRTTGAPSEEEKLEGLFQYFPELPISPTSVLSYYRGTGDRGAHTIYVAPALLESTCTVVAAGLDLFKGRASPSGAFDLLAEDFNYTLLALLIVGLAVGVVFLRSLERRKSLQAAWA